MDNGQRTTDKKMTDPGSVGIVKTQTCTLVQPPETFILENRAELSPITVAYETYGTLNATRDNAILVIHSLTGDAHAAGKYSEEDKYPGWWDPIIGPGKPFDTNKYFVICCNNLGGCKGTTGPASINPKTGKPYGMSFPIITLGDMVEVQKKLIDYLGVKSLVAVAGGSSAGMKVLEWGLRYSHMVRSIIPIATGYCVTPQGIAFHKVAQEAIMADPNWNHGDYYGKQPPKKGLAIARMIGHITYLSDHSMWEKFGRRHLNPEKMKYDLTSPFDVERYLEYQGEKFVQRFDANCYLYLLRAMDLYDASEGYSSLEESFKRITCKSLIISFAGDWLFPPYRSEELVRALRANGSYVEYYNINSLYGHDAFLLEYHKFGPLIRRFLARVTGEEAQDSHEVKEYEIAPSEGLLT
jgi:homoserine O-acetyltransferase